MSEHTIKIVDGHVQFVYSDELADLMDEGVVAVCRVSHVEPASTYCGGCSRPYEGMEPCTCGTPRRPVADMGWVADMKPVGGPLLGTYLTRAEALAGEREWLTEHRGL